MVETLLYALDDPIEPEQSLEVEEHIILSELDEKPII